MNKKIYDIWFSRIEISNKIKLDILNNFSTFELWNMDEHDLKMIHITNEDCKLKNMNLNDKIIKKILDLKYKLNIEKYLLYMEKNNIDIIRFNENKYPEKLKNIDDKPCFIYTRGNKKITYEDSVGIVGSRNATEYGKNISRRFAKEIADKNVNIVSGLAIGIDKYAHLGALDSKYGKTIAVLGTGVANNDLYPEENRRVFERILENKGLIISEYIMGTKANKYFFPARNRIISGLSDKLIVIEASKKSGSLITVDFALNQGKDVFAVPGNISSPNSSGTNNLIKEGAYIITNPMDVF